ncbi:MAG: hypothetical protein AB7E46_06105 [Desulfovibrio sp.]|jgi:hypothetical protein
MKVLGIVGWAKHDKVGNPIAGVQPLYEIQKQEWRKIDALEEFPTQGQAFWPAAHAASEGILVYFRAEPNVGQKDEFRVVDPKIAIEVLDLRSVGDPTKVRSALVDGLRWNGPAFERALLWCQPDILVGPVDLVRTPTETLKLNSPNLARIPTFANCKPKRIHDGRQERLLRIDETPATGYVDWDDDVVVMKRAIEASVRFAKQVGQDTGMTKRQIENAARALAAQGAGADAQLDLYRLERACALCANSVLIAKLAPKLFDSLRVHPDIAEMVTNLETTVRREMELTARSELAEKLSTTQQALQKAVEEHKHIIAEIETEERKRDDVRRELDALQLRANDSAQEIETAISQRVRAALDRPLELLAEVSVLRPLLGYPRLEAQQNDSAVVVGSVRTALEWSGPRGDEINDRKALQRALIAAARARGVAPASMMQLHAAVAARLMPVLVGPGGLATLAAYAYTACGNRLAILHVSPGFIQPSDLSGNTVRGQFDPHPTGLLSAGAAAKNVDGLSLLLFEGANRSPLEASIVPLLQLNDAGVAHEVPPAGLRLSATIVAGPTTVPVTPQIWYHAVAISTELVTPIPGSPRLGDMTMSSDLLTLGDVPVEEIDSLIEICPECAELRPVLERYGSALSRVYSESARIRNALVEGVVLPYIVTALCEEEQDVMLRELDNEGETLLADTAKRLRRRLC